MVVVVVVVVGRAGPRAGQGSRAAGPCRRDERAMAKGARFKVQANAFYRTVPYRTVLYCPHSKLLHRAAVRAL